MMIDLKKAGLGFVLVGLLPVPMQGEMRKRKAMFEKHAGEQPVKKRATGQGAKPGAQPAVDEARKTKSILFDASRHENDYNCVVWLSEAEYKGQLVGVKQDVIAKLSPKKHYFNIAFFEGDKLVKKYAFPAALLVEAAEYESWKPSFLSFVPRSPTKAGTVAWDREILSVEGGNLVKYNVWCDRDPQTKQLAASVDFGKRIPIYTGVIDEAYVPWANPEGDIFFMAKDREGVLCWDSREETVRPARAIQAKPEAATAYDATTKDGGASVTSGSKAYNVAADVATEVIDPLSINEARMLAPFKDFGTDSRPLTRGDATRLARITELSKKQQLTRLEADELGRLSANLDEYDSIVFTQRAAPGLIMALSALPKIVVKPPLSDVEQTQLQAIVKDLKATYDKSKSVIQELKLLMHEKGAKSILKKWLSDAEVQGLMSALAIPGSVVETRKDGQVVQDHRGRIEVGGDAHPQKPLYIPWGYYRKLKDTIRNKTIDNPAQWESYTSEEADGLKRAIQQYSKLVVKQGDNLKTFMTRFMAVPEQKSWDVWFERENKELDFELLFDYLASLLGQEKRQKLVEVLGGAGVMGRIKQQRMMAIVEIYMRSNLYAGLKTKRMIKKAAKAAMKRGIAKKGMQRSQD